MPSYLHLVPKDSWHFACKNILVSIVFRDNEESIPIPIGKEMLKSGRTIVLLLYDLICLDKYHNTIYVTKLCFKLPRTLDLSFKFNAIAHLCMITRHFYSPFSQMTKMAKRTTWQEIPHFMQPFKCMPLQNSPLFRIVAFQWTNRSGCLLSRLVTPWNHNNHKS